MKNNKGFTLLEVVVTVGILSLIMGYFMNFYSNEIRVYRAKDNEIELKQDARIAMDRISTKIRQNNGLALSSSENGNKIMQGTNILINAEKNDPNKGDIYFKFDNAKNIGAIYDGSDNLIADNIKEFTLEQENGNEIATLVRITIKAGNKNSDEDKTYTTLLRMFK